MLHYDPAIQLIDFPIFWEKNITVSVLRLDLLHEKISGNKWFKLKYNLAEAKKEGHDTLLTFGGAFSNHIVATAWAARLAGLKSIGVIRGESSSENNSTLTNALEAGMQLHFVSREDYKRKQQNGFIADLQNSFGKFYLVPEGGNNPMGALGSSEILTGIKQRFGYVFCACGTGTTFAGLLRSKVSDQKIIGISVLKGDQSEMLNSVQNLLDSFGDQIPVGDNKILLQSSVIEESGILNQYHFGGYAKHTEELLSFKDYFERHSRIPLDYVYTSKLFFAVFDLISKNKIPEGTNILIIHSGGLQGNKGYENRYALKPMRIVTDIQG